MRNRIANAGAVLVLAATLIMAPGGRAWAASWQLVIPPSNGGIYGISAGASNDVWAVGQDSITFNPLAEHWDGIAWSVVATPPLDSGSSFDTVATLPSGRAWAVGSQISGPDRETLTLAESWNGTRWRLAPTPNLYVGQQGDDNTFIDVSAVSAKDVWAVGFARRTGAPTLSIAEHWDGTSWTVSSFPQLGADSNALDGVSMLSAGYGLAVGVVGKPYREVVGRWGNGIWQVKRLAGSANQALRSVQVLSRQSSWAVGSEYVSSTVPFIEHFQKGSGWSVVPSGISDDGELYAIAASTLGDMWAVGIDFSHPDQTLITHWEGSAWTQVVGPPATSAWLRDVTVVPGSEEAWAVGSDAAGPILLHYS